MLLLLLLFASVVYSAPGDRVVYEAAASWDGAEFAALGTFGEPEPAVLSLAPAVHRDVGTIINDRLSMTIIKTPDTLKGVGTGVSYRLTRLGEAGNLYLDLAPYYDGKSDGWGAFGGISTDTATIPLLGVLLERVQNAVKAGCTSVGYGYSTRSRRGMLYAGWRF